MSCEKSLSVKHNPDRKKILKYLKHLCDDYGIESTSTVSLKRKLLKKFEKELYFLPSVIFVIVHCSTINPCQYSAAVLKGQGFQDKYHVRSFEKVVWKIVKIMVFKALLKIPEDMLEKTSHLDNAASLIS